MGAGAREDRRIGGVYFIKISKFDLRIILYYFQLKAQRWQAKIKKKACFILFGIKNLLRVVYCAT